MLAINCNPFNTITWRKASGGFGVCARMPTLAIILVALAGNPGLARSGPTEQPNAAPQLPAIANTLEEPTGARPPTGDAASSPTTPDPERDETETPQKPVVIDDFPPADGGTTENNGETVITDPPNETPASPATDEGEPQSTEEFTLPAMEGGRSPVEGTSPPNGDATDGQSTPAPTENTEPASLAGNGATAVGATAAAGDIAAGTATNGKFATRDELNSVAVTVLGFQMKLEALQQSSIPHSRIATIESVLDAIKKQIDELSRDKTSKTGSRPPPGDEPSNGDIDTPLDTRLDQIEKRLARIELALRDRKKADTPSRVQPINTPPSSTPPVSDPPLSTPPASDPQRNTGDRTRHLDDIEIKRPVQADRLTRKRPFDLISHQDGTPALQRKGLVAIQYLSYLADAGQCSQIGAWLQEAGIKLPKRVVFVQKNNRVAKCKQLRSGEWKVYSSGTSDTGYVAVPRGG